MVVMRKSRAQAAAPKPRPKRSLGYRVASVLLWCVLIYVSAAALISVAQQL